MSAHRIPAEIRKHLKHPVIDGDGSVSSITCGFAGAALLLPAAVAASKPQTRTELSFTRTFIKPSSLG